MRRLLTFTWACLYSHVAWAQCGGVERWAVKMGADSGAAAINVNAPVPTLLHPLVQLPTPSLPSDDATRATAEQTVRVVDARLVKFKQETGKTGDADFHLVVSDDTLLSSPGGTGTQASPHSVIAEVVDPDCVAGRHGQVTTPSSFATQLMAVRQKFLQQFPNIRSGWNDGGGIPVRLTGVGFFDRAHGQVGRALNRLELHPLLDIEFNPAGASTSGTGTPTTFVTVTNPGFENGSQGWTATAGVIVTGGTEPAHSGNGKAWLGGHDEAHTDRLSRQVTLPSTATAISLTFFLHIDTDESNQQAFDKMRVRVRRSNGQFQTLQTFSNQQAAPGFFVQSFDLSSFRGQTIRIDLEAKEDDGSQTSFVVDDFAIVVES